MSLAGTMERIPMELLEETIALEEHEKFLSYLALPPILWGSCVLAPELS